MTIKDRSGSRKILLTGGRAPAALELARLLHAAGHTVYAAECAPFHLCRVSRSVARSFAVPAPVGDPQGFIEALRSIVEELGIDMLIPTCEEIFHITKGIDRLSGKCRVFASPLELLDRVHHKGSFIRLAERSGLQAPATESVDSADGWIPLLAHPRFRKGLVLKPAYSRFASSVLFADPEAGPLTRGMIADISRKLADAGISPARPWVAQELLQGEEWCTYSVAHEGTVAAHAAYRSRFRAGRGASIHFEAASRPPLQQWVERFVRHTGFTGQIAFDFIVRPDGGVFPLECNPRATSGIHLFGPDDRLAEALLEPERLLADRTVAAPSPVAGSGAMLSAAMLTVGLAQAARQRKLRDWLRAYRGSRDVVFRSGDAKPAAEQFRLLAWLRRTAGRRGLSLQEASTLDIEWNGER